jgi:hypothetical protein
MVIKVYWNCFVNIMSECLGHKVHMSPQTLRIELELRARMKIKFKIQIFADKENFLMQ